MTYEERVEQAIAGNDIETLVKFIYGYPCKCTKIKGRADVHLQDAGKSNPRKNHSATSV